MGQSARARRFTDFYNDPSDANGASPYVRLSVRYLYTPESYVEAGFTYDRSATDLVGYDGNGFTTDANTASVFASLNHQLTAKLKGSIMGQYQNSTYNNGSFNNESENFYLVGLNLEYQFNRNFSAQAGYNYDNLSSKLTDVDRGFDRNRVYIGVTAKY